MNSHQESSESSSGDEAMIVLSYMYRASKITEEQVEVVGA